MGGPEAAAVEGSGVDVVEKYGSFVLNIKVLGSDAGAGVPTLPVRVPQIVDSRNRLSFHKLLDVVIMIASSQGTGVHTSSANNETIQHHVLLSFPNTETQNSVMISTAEELVQLMERHKQKQQLTLIAKVQHEVVQKKPSFDGSSSDGTTADRQAQEASTPTRPKKISSSPKRSAGSGTPTKLSPRSPLATRYSETSPKSPTRKPSLPMNMELTMPSLGLEEPEEEKQNDEEEQEPVRVPTKPTLIFDPPDFKLPTNDNDPGTKYLKELLSSSSSHPSPSALENPFAAAIDSSSQSAEPLPQIQEHTTTSPATTFVLQSLMEQLLEVQSHRMQQFADHMEDRFQKIIDRRLVTSEDKIKQCLRETVQLVEEDCKEDDSVSSDESASPPKQSSSSATTNLEKIVKDQMVSMELRFAKLEEQSKEASVLAKIASRGNSPTGSPPSTPPPTIIKNDDKALHQRLDKLQSKMEEKLDSMESLMKATKNATTLALVSSPPPGPAAQKKKSNKPPLPPSHRNSNARASPPEPILLPRLQENEEELPPSISTPPPSEGQQEPVSPPTTERSSLLVPPPLSPMSPPDSIRSSVATDTFTDDSVTVSETRLSFATSTSSNVSDITNYNVTTQLQDNINIDDSARTAPTSNEARKPETMIPITPGEPTSPSAIQYPTSLGMPSLATITTESSIPTGGGGPRKKTVRDMLLAQQQQADDQEKDSSNNNKGKTKKENASNKAKTSLPILFPMLDASRGDLYLSSPTKDDDEEKESPPKPSIPTSAFESPTPQIQPLPFSSPPLIESPDNEKEDGKAKPPASPTPQIQPLPFSSPPFIESPDHKKKETAKQPTSPTPRIQPLPFSSPPLIESPDSEEGKQTKHPATNSEKKMKQAIKDHMQSMESRVSKLRELNKQSAAVSTPTTAALTPGTTLSSPRSLFSSSPPDVGSMERALTQKMDSLSESLQTTIEDTTKASVDTKMADLEALLQRKLQQIQKAVSLAANGSGHGNDGPPTSPKRKSSKPDPLDALEVFMEGQMDQLAELIQTNQEKVVQQLAISRTVVETQQPGEDSPPTISVPASALMDQVQSVLDKRMDNIETLVQLTATEIEANNKATQQRMNQRLLEEMTEMIQNTLPPGEDSMDTSKFPTVYGDEDHTVEVEDQHRVGHTEEEESDINNSGSTSSSSGAYRRGRSLEADLVAMDREASIREIYGDMDIDDVDEMSSGDPTGHSRGTLGRGKSLRDLCNIDTIEEEDGEEADEVTSRHSDPGTIESVASEISARSASVRHIYGDESVDIDDADHQPNDHNNGSDTPPVMARRSVSVKTLSTTSSAHTLDEEGQSFGSRDTAQADRRPWIADRAELAKIDRPPSQIDRVASVHSSTTESDMKDRAPSLVDRAVSVRAINIEPDNPPGRSGMPSPRRDSAPSPVNRAVSTRAIYGEADIDQGRSGVPSPRRDSAPAIVSRVVSTRAIYGEADIDPGTTEAPSDRAPVPVDRAGSITSGTSGIPTAIPGFPDIVVDRAVPTHSNLPDRLADNADNHESSLSSMLESRSSLVDRAVSTRALVGEDNEDNKNASLSSMLESRGSLVDRAVSTRALVGVGEITPTPSIDSDIPDILEFYDGLDIDIDGDIQARSAGPQAVEIDPYDNLSLDGVEETHAFVSTLEGSENHFGVDLDEELEDGEEVESDDQESVSIDGNSVPLSISTSYDSDSSKEDEEYFHDHARKHLSVLATSIAKIRAAEKGTSRYVKFQENIFISKRKGPLAIKVMSTSDNDAAGGGKSMHLSDDGSSREDSNQQSAQKEIVDTSSDENASISSYASESAAQPPRDKKAQAFLVAMAVTDRRVADRAIRVYRDMLRTKFLPKRRKGPMALTDRSHTSARVREDSNPPSSASSVSDVYVDDAGSEMNEPMAASIPSIDTGGGIDDAGSETNEPMAASIPSIDTGGDINDAGSETSERMAASIPSIDTGGGSGDADTDKNEPMAVSIPFLDTRGAGSAPDEPMAGSIPSLDSGTDFDASGFSLSNPSLDCGSAVVVSSIGGGPFQPFPPFKSESSGGGLHRQETVDSCWRKPLKEESDSGSEGSSPEFKCRACEPEIEESPSKEDPPAMQGTTFSQSSEEEEGTHAQSAHSAASIFRRIESSVPVVIPDVPAADEEAYQPPELRMQEGGFASESLRAPHSAESGEEQGAFKPEQMAKHLPPHPKMRKESWKPFDESEHGLVEDEEKEIEEWEAVAKSTSTMEPATVTTRAIDAGESKQSEDDPILASVILADRLQEVKAQMDKFQDIFLVSNQNQKASNDAVKASNSNLQAKILENSDLLRVKVQENNDLLRVSNDSLRISNENLQTSVQESIEDSHHFAAYLDKMLSERIGRLEHAIRSQAIPLANTSRVFAPITTEGRLSHSAPNSPLNHNWTGPAAAPSSMSREFELRQVLNSADESKEAEHVRVDELDAKRAAVEVMAVEATEWKRLQERLRGTEEVAESYRQQVMQLRNVLEVKMNEGNTSQHQVELLQRKLEEAHYRELEAQKQLRPVTKRVEQVIQEMVRLEERSSNLEVENGRLRQLEEENGRLRHLEVEIGRLRQQLWMAEREF